jgi:hypothetical protein
VACQWVRTDSAAAETFAIQLTFLSCRTLMKCQSDLCISTVYLLALVFSQFLMVNLSLSKWDGSIDPFFNSALYQVWGQLYAPAALPPEKVHVVWSPELVWKSGKDARFLLLCSMSLSCLWLTMWYREGWNILLLVASWKKTVISSNKHTESGIPEQRPTQHSS